MSRRPSTWPISPHPNHVAGLAGAVAEVELGQAARRAPFGAAGRALVKQLDAGRVLVDLAHILEAGFWGAVDAHDPTLPLVVTHTGVDGVWPHWRNLSDDQIRAVADSEGCVGVMLQESFLGKRPTSAATVVDHLAHLVAVGGEGCPAIGTDFDGMVTPPRDLARHAHFPRLVEEIRRRRWTDDRIRAVLGGNAVRTVESRLTTPTTLSGRCLSVFDRHGPRSHRRVGGPGECQRRQVVAPSPSVPRRQPEAA